MAVGKSAMWLTGSREYVEAGPRSQGWGGGLASASGRTRGSRCLSIRTGLRKTTWLSSG